MTHHNGLFVEYCAKDFLDGTQTLDPWEELAYRRICDLIYATEDNLADDDKRLAWQTKTGNRWPRIKAELVAQGKILLVEGRITNRRCQKTLEKSARNILQKSAAGKASAATRNALKNKETNSTAVGGAVATTVITAEVTNQEPKNPYTPNGVINPPSPLPDVPAEQDLPGKPTGGRAGTTVPGQDSAAPSEAGKRANPENCPLTASVPPEATNPPDRRETAPSDKPTRPSVDVSGMVEVDFRAWWQLTPRKVGRGQALKAYRAARKLTDAATLEAGIRRYAAEQSGKDPQFIKHPATWLNGQCWADEAQPSGAQSHAGKINRPRPGAGSNGFLSLAQREFGLGIDG